jgi:hypothetical protein
MEVNAPKRLGTDAKAAKPHAPQRKAFQNRAAGDHALKRVVRDADIGEDELLEARKARQLA